MKVEQNNFNAQRNKQVTLLKYTEIREMGFPKLLMTSYEVYKIYLFCFFAFLYEKILKFSMGYTSPFPSPCICVFGNKKESTTKTFLL